MLELGTSIKIQRPDVTRFESNGRAHERSIEIQLCHPHWDIHTQLLLYVFPIQGGTRWSDQMATGIIKNCKRNKVELVLSSWIAHNFPKHLQKITDHQIQLVVFIHRHP